jgi:ubiquinone/menaquinone biosynthesis C-methylase UbiE
MLDLLVHKVSENPVLFIFFRSILENNFKSVRATIRRHLGNGADLRTLDLGCGPGAFAREFDSAGYTGVDLNARYIGYASKHIEGHFLVGDARRVELSAEQFDRVLIFGMLHHLSDEDATSVVSEVRRLLVPGGKALIIEDIPAISRLNLLGHLIHRVENGEHIRPAEDYRSLYSPHLRLEVEETLRSGVCDYHVALLIKPA